jgi:hypothetical protein
MTINKLLLATSALLLPSILLGQGDGVNPAELLKPLKDSWPTYNGEPGGNRRGLSRHFPGVLHGKGKLHKEGEHTEQRPSAI